MPHLATNRPRQYLRGWELTNVLCYLLGGAIFIPGSVFFLPQYEDNVEIGAVLFVLGASPITRSSVMYIASLSNA